MSITKPILLNETGLKIVDSLDNIAAILGATGTVDFSSWSKVQSLVKLGLAEKVLPVGSQITIKWTDTAANTTYDVPLDVVHYEKVTLEDGETVPGMFLQWHYTTPFGVQFSNYQAFYVNTSTAVLPAGTYNVTIPTTWSKATAGTYQFTLTKDLPIGGQLSGFETCADTAPANWKVKAWASNTATTVTETVLVTSGSDGTNLGKLTPAGDGTLNSIQEVGYGYNRWSVSAMRQWLNSNKSTNAWWVPKSNFDRYPNELLTKNGFMSGFSDGFLSVLAKVKTTTVLNTVTDSSIGTTEDTYDKFFLPSLQQEYITPQLADVEGSSFEYWKRASGSTSYAPWSTTMPNYVTYAVENHTSPQNIRLRSCDRALSYRPWLVNSSGPVFSNSAISSLRVAPVCVVA